MFEDAANPSGAAEVTNVDSAADMIASKLSDPKSDKKTTQDPEVKTDSPSKADNQSDEQEALDSEVEQTGFETLDELADAVGLSVDDFLGKIKGKVKINGEESELTLAELRNGYQRDADYRRKTMELADSRKQFEQVREQTNNEMSARLTQVGTLLQAVEGQLMSEFSSVNWQELRVTDPAEFAARNQEFQQRYAQLQHMKMAGANEVKRLQEESQKAQEKAFEEYTAKQAELLLGKVPEWSDSTLRSKEESEISKFLIDKYGFSKEDARIFSDHRLALLARDAFKGKDIEVKKELAQKKVANLPKLLKPGAKQSSADAKKDASRKEWDKIKKSNSNDALGAFLASKL